MASFYKAKIRNFPKGLTDHLVKNIWNFFLFFFFFAKKSFKTEFLDVLNTKETFLGYKNRNIS